MAIGNSEPSHLEDLKPRGGSLTDQAYSRLEELIVTLRLAPGAVLSEGALAERLGFGRTPIREALRRLARDGLVAIPPLGITRATLESGGFVSRPRIGWSQA